jgi:hypothetical protein
MSQEITPVEEFKDKPVGSVPEIREYVIMLFSVSEAEIVVEYAIFLPTGQVYCQLQFGKVPDVIELDKI